MSLKDLDKLKDSLDDLVNKSGNIYKEYERLYQAAEAIYDNAESLEPGEIYTADTRVVSAKLLEELCSALRDCE
jgi:hypothetical protein